MPITLKSDKLSNIIEFHQLENAILTRKDFSFEEYSHSLELTQGTRFIRGVRMTLSEARKSELNAIIGEVSKNMGGMVWDRLIKGCSSQSLGLSHDQASRVFSMLFNASGDGVDGRFVVSVEREPEMRGRKTESHRNAAERAAMLRAEDEWEQKGDGLIRNMIAGINTYLFKLFDDINCRAEEELKRMIRQDSVSEDFALNGLGEAEVARHNEVKEKIDLLEQEIARMRKGLTEARQESADLRAKGTVSQLEASNPNTTAMKNAVEKISDSLKSGAMKPGADKESFMPGF